MDVVEAVQKRDLAALVRLLDEDPRRAEAATPQGISVLQLACYLRFSQGIEAMLAVGARPDVWAAATLGDVPRVRHLIAAEPSLRDAPGADGFPALHLAAHFGRTDALRNLLSLGAPPGLVGGPPLANTALHAALAGSQVEAARILVAAGAPVDARDHGGNTPMHIAAANGLDDAVALLDKAGAQLDARNAQGKTPYDVAVEREAVRVMAYLEPR